MEIVINARLIVHLQTVLSSLAQLKQHAQDVIVGILHKLIKCKHQQIEDCWKIKIKI